MSREHESRLSEAPYLQALVALRERDPMRLMVPGHKGAAVPAALAEALGEQGARDLLGLDVPQHLVGIDVGPPHPAPAQRALDLAAQAWGAQQTWFVLGGASQANQILCLALAMLAPRERRLRVAVQRNVHQSVVYGMILADAEVVWLDPEVDDQFGIQHCVSPATLERALAPGGIDAAIVVSPTYYGAVSDVAALSEVVARARTPSFQTLLVVDEAWGAHFPFGDVFPTSAVTLGADIVTSSIHKNVGSLTQSAMLHVATAEDKLRLTVTDAIRQARHLVKTTSPSSLLFASLDAARAYAQGEGGRLLTIAAQRAGWVRAQVATLPGVEVIDERIVERASVAAFDPLRVTLEVTGTGLTGGAVRDALLEAGVEVEFCTHELVVLAFGLGDGVRDWTRGAVDALAAIVAHAQERTQAHAPPPAAGEHEDGPSSESLLGFLAASERPVARTTLRAAFLGEFQDIELERSAGRVCVELVAPYPPGIALVMPGEEISPQMRDYLMRISAPRGGARGPEFADCKDPTLRHIRVLAEGGPVSRRWPRRPAPGRTPPAASS